MSFQILLDIASPVDTVKRNLLPIIIVLAIVAIAVILIIRKVRAKKNAAVIGEAVEPAETDGETEEKTE